MPSSVLISARGPSIQKKKEVLEEFLRSSEISIIWERLAHSSFVMIFSVTGFSLTRMLQSFASSVVTSEYSYVFTNTGAFVSQEQQRSRDT